MNTSLQAWQARGQHFQHRGHSIFFIDEKRGDGAALLLIHGFPTASWDYADIWPLIAPRFGRLIAPDMIGYGFSDKPADYPYDLVDQADLHERLLEQLGIREVHLLVHDIGVSVAQELLARHHERRSPKLELLSVTLLNGGLFPETHRATRAQKLLLGRFGWLVSKLNSRARFGESFSAVFGPDTQPSAAQLDAFWQLMQLHNGHRLMHRLIRYILDRRRNRERWVGALQNTTVPLHLINGPLDPVSGAHMVQRYCELVPQPDVQSLPGLGHYPHVESPQAVAEAFLAFIDRLA